MYVTDGVAFPLWLRIDEEAKFIVMLTYINRPRRADVSIPQDSGTLPTRGQSKR